MTHSDFVHLHLHTQYSLLDGACLLEKVIDKAVELHLPALAITDHGNIFGAIKFYNICIKKGIKPIIGCEMYVAPTSRLKKDSKLGEESNFHLILLVKNEEGYRNLLRLVSLANLEGFYYKPRIDKELLCKYNKGLIATTACLKGEIPSLILAGDTNRAYKLADEYQHIFGKENFYFEIMDNGLSEQGKVNSTLLKMAGELNVPYVATNDIHYLNKGDFLAHEILLCIQTQTTLSDPKHFKFNSDSFYFKTPQEMKMAFKDTPLAIRNTLEITQKCNLTFDFSKIHLPHFPIQEGENESELLKKICYEGLKKRYPDVNEEITKRLEYELSVIKKTGFCSYFLIIWDLVKFAKEKNIPVGPGRGSAAGSIVSFLLGITDIDPLKYNLLFERFLNPARISMPDIDMDFCYERRGEILGYVTKKYGEANVAQIITFGTMLARAVIRDVGRVVGLSYSDVDKIAKMIPYTVGHHVSLKEALSGTPELSEIYNSDNEVKRLIDVAMQLEGLSRHASTHAAGVVISDKPLIERVPLIRGADDEIVTGFAMDDLEKTGLLKMDFLGLKTLTVIEETKKIIKAAKGIELDIAKITLNDKKTFSLLANGDTIGVFQLESRGMREILKKLIPTKFEDLIAVLALYRPGPLGSGMVDDFINRKQGKKMPTYIHPKLEPVLKETYGIILYQEQTMQIVSVLAGFDMSRADLLRKAIGKKIPEIMDEQRSIFLEGCKKNHISTETADKIFDLIDYFSGYGFNKSHSTAYALISYQTAYLKANFTHEFMAALLTSECNNTDKIVMYVNELRRCEIKILPPDINTSFVNFTVTADGSIRFGLMAIKNVGRAALDNIIEERKKGSFKNIQDFCERIDSRTVNKKVIESMIKAGAMDTFGFKRAQMAAILNNLLMKPIKRDTSQMLLFSLPQEEKIPEIEEWPLSQILSFEKSLLGLYLSGHPLYIYSTLSKFLFRQEISSFFEDERIRRDEVSVCGVVEKARIISTKKGDRMAILRIEDETAGMEVVIFPRLFRECEMFLNEKALVVIKGTLEAKDKIPKILAEKVISIDNVLQNIKEINISVEQGKLPLNKLKDIFMGNPGKTPVFFLFKNSSAQNLKIKTANKFSLNPSEQNIQEISSLVGETNVSLVV